MAGAEPQEGQGGESREGHEKKIAVLGFAESWKLAPFDDPTVKVFGLNELWKYVPRWDYWIEVHDAATLGITKRDLSEGEQKRHLEWLAKSHGTGKSIFMQPQFCDGRFPNATPFPIERLTTLFGRYFTSSIGMMIAWAIAEGYTWIGLYGIDLASDIEYPHQRPNAEYLVGVARGMGRTVVIPEQSALLKASYLYGYEQPPAEAGGILTAVRTHQAGLKKKHDETLALLNTLDGAIQETENFVKLHDYTARGCHLETY